MIEGWVTRDANSLLQPMQPVAFSRSLPQEALPTIEIDDSRTFQPIEGFGFALTGGSAYLLAGLAAAERADLLQELFGLTEASVGLSCLRLSIGASDLGRKDFSYWDLRRGTVDPDLARFNLSVCDRGGRSGAAGDLADQSGGEDHRFAVVGAAVDEDQRQLRGRRAEAGMLFGVCTILREIRGRRCAGMAFMSAR